MRIYSGITGAQLGAITGFGKVTTSDQGLLSVLQEINQRGFVTPFTLSKQQKGGGVQDHVAVIRPTDPGYVFGLMNVLERNGFIVVLEETAD